MRLVLGHSILYVQQNLSGKNFLCEFGGCTAIMILGTGIQYRNTSFVTQRSVACTRYESDVMLFFFVFFFLQISDFGMSRDLEDENYYVSHGGKIPVKWTAPEVSTGSNIPNQLIMHPIDKKEQCHGRGAFNAGWTCQDLSVS